MVNSPSPAAKRPRRRGLDKFPCYHGWHDAGYMCSAGCRDRVDTGEWRCVILPVYRDYLALQRCARLLGIYERWHIRAQLAADGPGRKGLWQLLSHQSHKLHRYIRSALRKAGL